MGYHRAGFEVVGVDNRPQKRYPFEFHKADALTFSLNGYDVIHASPPCQAYSALRHLRPENDYPDLVAACRARIDVMPYVIENVPRSPLHSPVMCCGRAFGLKVKRHRLFESNCQISGVLCCCKGAGSPIDVSGTGGRRINRRPNDHGGNTNKPRNIAEAREAMGIDWMTRKELSQAIPPAYTEWIGKQLLEQLEW